MGRVLWMVNHYAALPDEWGGTRHYWLARGLQERGWDVRIIRSGPMPDARSWKPLIQTVGGVEVTSLGGWPWTARGAGRVLSWAEFAAWLRERRATVHLPEPDLVLGSTVHLPAAWAARGLARRHRVPFVFEVRDLWPETLIAMGALRPSAPAAVALRGMERSLARSATLIISPLSGVGRYMTARYGIPPERFAWISNGVHFPYYAALEAPPEDGLRLQYFGSIGTANDVDSIVEAIGIANDRLTDPVMAQIRGFGPGRDGLMQRVASDARLAATVRFPEPVAAHDVPQAMQWGNVLVLIVRDMPELYRYGISMNKLFDYVASGRWLIMAATVPENPIAEAPGLTLCGPTARSLADAIVTVARMDPHERNRLARGNATLARERFDYRVLAGELASVLDGVLGRGGAG